MISMLFARLYCQTFVVSLKLILCLDIPQKHLVCNPQYRITADEALKHPYFSDLDPTVAAWYT